jgi:hypothetical protein
MYNNRRNGIKNMANGIQEQATTKDPRDYRNSTGHKVQRLHDQDRCERVASNDQRYPP